MVENSGVEVQLSIKTSFSGETPNEHAPRSQGTVTSHQALKMKEVSHQFTQGKGAGQTPGSA
jgi:hypothetical protein